MCTNKINLFDFTHEDLVSYLKQIGEKPFRATQIIKWLHQQRVTDFNEMTNLAKNFRQYLIEHAEIVLPEVVKMQVSRDGTVKWLLKLQDANCILPAKRISGLAQIDSSSLEFPRGGEEKAAGVYSYIHDRCERRSQQSGKPKCEEYIEMVFIPEEDRGTLCISTQVGCPLACDFCATGKQGFTRNLTLAEIIGQLWLAKKDRTVTNVVIMGMGEPLLNFDNTLHAVQLMLDDNAYGLSKYKVTVSTSGLVPEMRRFSKLSDVAFAVSLHAPNDELRSKFMPINKKYPLKELMAACREHFADKRRKITFEYIMIAGVNDSLDCAKQLVRLLYGIPCKINLIPCNEHANNKYKASTQSQIDKFRDILMAAGFNTITRKTRGADIDAACGQLAGSNKK